VTGHHRFLIPTEEFLVYMPPPCLKPPLLQAVHSVAGSCDECLACVRQCAFLTHRGTPRALALLHAHEGARLRDLAFECSLCGLCSAVCPNKAEPMSMFLELRRAAVRNQELDLSPYRTILTYERRGFSPLLRYRGLPQGCDTVLFPGCTLPGARPQVTWRLFEHLRTTLPSLGVVLECCAKPSHDLGRQAHFESRFFPLRDALVRRGVRRVLVACPNCLMIFRRYGAPLEVCTVYEQMQEHGLPQLEGARRHEAVTVHDPCPLRHEPGVQEAVRALILARGLDVVEMRHRKTRTFCCGEGGSVGFRSPENATGWGELRRNEARGRRVLTACAGCVIFLQRHMDAVHVLDLVFRPHVLDTGNMRVVRSPWTWLRRLQLKARFMRAVG
jgi:Fe-S oxidoreductase